jgi:hypothetical protein
MQDLAFARSFFTYTPIVNPNGFRNVDRSKRLTGSDVDMWIILLLIIILLLLNVVYCLLKISNQLKLISDHFNVKEKEVEIDRISDEEIEKELENELLKK